MIKEKWSNKERVWLIKEMKERLLWLVGKETYNQPLAQREEPNPKQPINQIELLFLLNGKEIKWMFDFFGMKIKIYYNSKFNLDI